MIVPSFSAGLSFCRAEPPPDSHGAVPVVVDRLVHVQHRSLTSSLPILMSSPENSHKCEFSVKKNSDSLISRHLGAGGNLLCLLDSECAASGLDFTIQCRCAYACTGSHLVDSYPVLMAIFFRSSILALMSCPPFLHKCEFLLSLYHSRFRLSIQKYHLCEFSVAFLRKL